MYQLVVSGSTLRVLDSQRERLALKCLNGTLKDGHYRVPMAERFAPATQHYGPGRAFISALSQRDVEGLVASSKCERLWGDRLKFDRQPGLRTPEPIAETSLHGGAETLSPSIAVARYQPLTLTTGIRLHNLELQRLLEFLDLRLRIGQLIVLTVLPEPT